MAKNETYEEFVDKFKPKKTTDDCYTPPATYDAVKNWVVKEYNLQNHEIVRPFYPGGDFQNFEYTPNCVVIDNPPFSILSKIKKFYIENQIKFFLFAPHLTLFASDSQVSYVVTDSKIVYENGARVNTSFVTNLESKCCIRTAPTLKSDIESSQRVTTVIKPKYQYPSNVISSTLLGKITTLPFKINLTECAFIRNLDSQKKCRKSIFGGGYLVSDKKAAELKVAELKVAELTKVWSLSNREKQIISNLNNRENH